MGFGSRTKIALRLKGKNNQPICIQLLVFSLNIYYSHVPISLPYLLDGSISERCPKTAWNVIHDVISLDDFRFQRK